MRSRFRRLQIMLVLVWTIGMWIAAVAIAGTTILSTEPLLPSDTWTALMTAAFAAISGTLGVWSLRRASVHGAP
jgi:hypothetical protein